VCIHDKTVSMSVCFYFSIYVVSSSRSRMERWTWCSRKECLKIVSESENGNVAIFQHTQSWKRGKWNNSVEKFTVCSCCYCCCWWYSIVYN
jgi:hypothetical protein